MTTGAASLKVQLLFRRKIMAYAGYLFKFGNYIIPGKYIDADSVNITPNRRLDINSYTDGDGVTQRNTLQHTRTTIEFKTGSLYESEMDEISSGITSNYINPLERDAMCEYYDTENRCYKTGHFYLDSNMTWNPGGTAGGEMIYKPCSFSFVEY